jgi:anti-anti-sigma regulatory factor
VTSAEVRAVLLLGKKMKSAGGSLAVCSVRDSVREVLDVSGSTSMLSIHPARAEAIAAMGK